MKVQNFRMVVRVAGLTLGALLLSGCIEATTHVHVNKDGSGTVKETVYFRAGMEQMMMGMAAMGQMDGGVPSLINEDSYREKAQTMGAGVRYESSREVAKPDGSKGVEVVYVFDDVRTLRITQEPDVGPAGMGDDETDEDPILFAFTPGGTAELTVKIPRPEEFDEAVDVDAGEEEMPSPQEMAMIKQMFDGFRFRLLLSVEGRILDSNATYVDRAGPQGTVTLMDMNIGKLLGDDAQFKKLAAMGQVRDMQKAKDLLKDFPDLKIETEETVTVRFQ